MSTSRILMLTILSLFCFVCFAQVEDESRPRQLMMPHPPERPKISQAVPNYGMSLSGNVKSGSDSINKHVDTEDVSSILSVSPADSIVGVFLAKFVMRGLTTDFITECKGKIEPYYVQRGETWESVARKFRVDGGMLRGLNPFEDELLVGLEISVPIFPKPTFEEIQSSINAPKFERAQTYERRGEWKEAVKVYNDIIKTSPQIDAYYCRGRAYYKLGKLKQATKDFGYVVAHDSDNKFPDANEIYQSVNDEWQAKKAERARFWGSVALGVLDMGLQVTDVVLKSKYGNAGDMMNYTPSYSSHPSGASSNGVTGFSWFQLDPSLVKAGITLPPSLDISRYFNADTFKMEVSYDQWGNPMYSCPGLANAMLQQQADFNRDMMSMSNGAGLSHSIYAQLHIQNQSVNDYAAELARPKYPWEMSNECFDDRGSDNSKDKSTDTGKKFKCAYCGGTGYQQISKPGVATYGTNSKKQKCDICERIWDPAIEIHSCVRCRHCDYWK